MPNSLEKLHRPYWLPMSSWLKKLVARGTCLSTTTIVTRHAPKTHSLQSIDWLVDKMSVYELLSFLDAYLGYNQTRI